MDLIKIEEMLKLAIKTQNWGMVEKIEKEFFCEDALNNLLCCDWKQEDSDLRKFFKNPDRTKIDFINLFYYGTTNQKDFLNANFDRLDEMIDILYEWLKEYDNKEKEEKKRISLKDFCNTEGKITLEDFWKSKEKLAIHCDTEEKAEKLLKEFDKMGQKWANGDDYTKFNCWKTHEENTCYGDERWYSSIDWYKINGYKVYEFKDVIFEDE
jgi:hypothetical protein